MNIFADDVRRSPWDIYDQLRSHSPLFRVPPPFNAWMLFDYDSVKRALNDHDAFSSQVPAPKHWFLFLDPPAHSKLRGLIASAFTPRMIASLEVRIRELSQALLKPLLEAESVVDLAAVYSVPLPMQVIATMLGIPPHDWPRFYRWSDTILKLSHSRSGGEEAEQALREFGEVSQEMDAYLAEMVAARKSAPSDDLLGRLIHAEIAGERLSHPEILGFFQLLVVAGQETTANLINNAVLSFLEHPDQMAQVRANRPLLPNAIEETLRFRSPVQWMMRTPKRSAQLHGQTLEPGELLLPMIGAANRDPQRFDQPGRFDVLRDPNPHIAFGHGIHSCLGAALARMEARIALSDLLDAFPRLELASLDPWPPRQALHVYGPEELKLRLG